MNAGEALSLYNEFAPITAAVAIVCVLLIAVGYSRARRDARSASARINAALQERDAARQLLERSQADLRRSSMQYGELQKRTASLVALQETIRHDIYKHLQRVADALKKNGQQDTANDLYSTADKIKFHLQANFEHMEYVQLETEGGTSLPANGESIASLVRYFSRILEKEDVIDIEGDQTLGMSGKRFSWDLLLHYILTNAIEHLRPGGRIRVNIESDGKNLGRVDISNDGKPIPKKFRKQVFELGYSDKPDDKKQPGFGIGLFMARRIAAGMDGAEILEPTTVYRYLLFPRGVRFSIVNLPVIPAPQ